MVKVLKPGQIFVHKGAFLRVKRRTFGCEGCVLNNIYVCPRIKVRNGVSEDIPCKEQEVIFIKFK